MCVHNIISAHKVAIKLCWILVVSHFDLSETLLCVHVYFIVITLYYSNHSGFAGFYSNLLLFTIGNEFLCFPFAYLLLARSFALLFWYHLCWGATRIRFHFISNSCLYMSYLLVPVFMLRNAFILLFICFSWSPAKYKYHAVNKQLKCTKNHILNLFVCLCEKQRSLYCFPYLFIFKPKIRRKNHWISRRLNVARCLCYCVYLCHKRINSQCDIK